MSTSGDGEETSAPRIFELTAAGISPAVGQVEPPEVPSDVASDNPSAEISQTLDVWAKAMESNDPTRIAGCYGEQVDRYFLSLNVTNIFVQRYMETWLKDHNRRVITFVPGGVVFENQTETTATLHLVKHVVTADSAGTTERFTRSQLGLTKVGGEWKITSERDFK